MIAENESEVVNIIYAMEEEYMRLMAAGMSNSVSRISMPRMLSSCHRIMLWLWDELRSKRFWQD
jgi:hypothetical protein